MGLASGLYFNEGVVTLCNFQVGNIIYIYIYILIIYIYMFIDIICIYIYVYVYQLQVFERSFTFAR